MPSPKQDVPVDGASIPTTTPTRSPAVDPTRRRLLAGAAAATGTVVLGAPAIAQARPKLAIGYWPIAGGLAFFAAVELSSPEKIYVHVRHVTSDRDFIRAVAGSDEEEAKPPQRQTELGLDVR